MPSIPEEIFKCMLSGDLETIQHLLEAEGVTEESTEQDGYNTTGQEDEVGRTVLVAAGLLGRSAIVPELVRRGAQVDHRTARGYSSLHLAACWGRVETVRTLLELGADTQTRTFRGQRPVDLARRYSHTACADLLLLAEAKQDLMSYVNFVKDFIADSEKNLTKEEKNICTRVCSDTLVWMQSVGNTTVSDITAHREDMEDTLQPVLSMHSAQSEMSVKPGGKV
ncbi:ankyrin repeat domain-containing protein 45 [Brachyistius frenatus]|uniref:ankyrin repeat domain-containing protein 45 n=1 Tax=Brachyistius frenatus TaxID=100188 RepID=UPI0037E8482D